MRIHIGCELRFEFPQTTPMIATLNVHFSRVSELERPDYLITNPSVPIEGYRDSFGNWCNRLVAPSGGFSLGTDAIIRDSGMPDPIEVNALQHQVQHLPAEVMLFLLGSRYCETDRLSDEAWQVKAADLTFFNEQVDKSTWQLSGSTALLAGPSKRLRSTRSRLWLDRGRGLLLRLGRNRPAQRTHILGRAGSCFGSSEPHHAGPLRLSGMILSALSR